MTTALRSSDPLADDTGAATSAHLLTARRVLEARLGTEPTLRVTDVRRRARWRTWVVASALAVTLPVAMVIVVPAITARLGEPQLTGAVIGTATADGGETTGLTCGGGSSRAIRPDQADVRLWPTVLPPGWGVRQVFANATSGYGWCTAPSLVLAGTTPDGTVTGTVKVTGPGRDIRLMNDDRTARDTVAGMPARRLLGPDDVTPDPLMHRWVLTDRDNSDWYIEVLGYPLAVARQVLSGLNTEGTDVTWADVAGPDLQVLHRRAGPPYPTTGRRGTDWYVRVDDGSLGDRWLIEGTHVADAHRRQLEVWQGRLGGVSGDATPGSRLLTVGGRPAVLFRDAGRDVALYVDVAPGVQAFSNVFGDLPEVEAMLASLTNLDPDDPQLDRLAMPRGVDR